VWSWISTLNSRFAALGFIIIGVFAASWAVSILYYRLNRYDEIKVNSDPVG
jgi:high-affinity nickel-transport protein